MKSKQESNKKFLNIQKDIYELLFTRLHLEEFPLPPIPIFIPGLVEFDMQRFGMERELLARNKVFWPTHAAETELTRFTGLANNSFFKRVEEHYMCMYKSRGHNLNTQIEKEPPKDRQEKQGNTYCGFKPGFLLGKSF